MTWTGEGGPCCWTFVAPETSLHISQHSVAAEASTAVKGASNAVYTMASTAIKATASLLAVTPNARYVNAVRAASPSEGRSAMEEVRLDSFPATAARGRDICCFVPGGTCPVGPPPCEFQACS
jgi:hypothetical protein